MKKYYVLLLAMLLLALLVACGTDEDTGVSDLLPSVVPPSVDASLASSGTETAPVSTNPSDSETETRDPEPDPFGLEDSFPVELGFVTLRYPAQWQDSVQITGAGKHDPRERFSVSFSAGTQKLFDLLFNSEDGILLGTLRGDEYTTISVKLVPDLTDDAQLKMQEDVNTILQGLIAEYDFAPGERLSKEDSGVFTFRSKIGTLCYPNKWKDAVEIETTDAHVRFSHEGNKLFDLAFADGDGFLIGSVGDTPVYLVYYSANNEMERAMQDDVNVLLQALMERDDYSASAPDTPGKEEVFTIESRIGALRYPVKWKDRVTVEADDEQVSFSNGSVRLFALVFSEGEGYFLGTYGETPIYVVDYEVEGEENRAMQDDLNVIIQYLLEEPEFSLFG